MRRAASASMGSAAQRDRPAGAAFIGWMVAIMLALFGFVLLWVDLGAGGLHMFGGLSRDEAIREAASSGGVEWPGTTVIVREGDDGRDVVERRWLGMTEVRQSLVEERDGWYDGGSPSAGPGEMVQIALVCLVVPALAGVATSRVVKRSRAPLASGGLGPR